ncbi:MAG: TerC family protein [Fimbriimonadaceae bacterium]
MFGQTFAVPDLGKIGILVILEALLSADNALILAIMVRHLPKEQQKKALFYGLAGAFIFRLGAILLASSIASFWWLQGVGALYLFYLPIKHFVSMSGNSEHKGAAGASFWMTVLYADLADLAFAIDSVLVAVAIEPHPDKIWVVYAGAVLGIVLLRWAAGFFLTLLEKYPALDHLAYVLVGWAGVKLLFLTGHTFEAYYNKTHPVAFPYHFPELSPWVFWIGLALIVVVGSIFAFRQPPNLEDHTREDAAGQIDSAIEDLTEDAFDDITDQLEEPDSTNLKET